MPCVLQQPNDFGILFAISPRELLLNEDTGKFELPASLFRGGLKRGNADKVDVLEPDEVSGFDATWGMREPHLLVKISDKILYSEMWLHLCNTNKVRPNKVEINFNK